MPDASLFLAVVTLLYCLLFFDGWHRLFRDSDTGWHIRTGEAILTTHTLPATDPYSFTRARQPWLDWEWGADVLTGAAHRWSGPAGVAALFAVAIAACTWLWMRLTFAAGGDLLLSFALASPMLSTVNLHWLARPHIFGWILLLGCLLLLERRGRLAWFVVLGVLWANLHASFFLGSVVALLIAAGQWLAPRVWNIDSPRDWTHPAKAALILFVASFANPYGWKLHAHVAAYLSDTELLSRIGEFQSFNFHVAGSAQIVLTAALGAAGAVLAWTNRRLDHAFVAALILVIALRSARGLPLVALAVLPLSNAALVTALRSARGLVPRLRRAIDSALDYSARLRTIDAGLSGYALLPILLGLLILVAPRADAGFPAEEFPVAAASAVATLPNDARVLAPDKFGGYLIYRFHGARPVFFDGRSDFYGAAFMKDYIRLVEARPGWREQVAGFGFTHALLPSNYSLISGLELAGWRRTYQDATAVLLAAPGH